MRVLTVAGLVGVASILIGCVSSGAGSAPSVSPPSLPSVAGRTYLSTEVKEGGAPRPLVPDTRIRLQFDAATLGAQAGCNSMSGGYTIAGGALRVGTLATTQMGCDPARMAQDQWLEDFLVSGPIIVAVDTGLTLDNGRTQIVLLDREVAEPDLPLVGPTWVVESLFQGDTVSTTAGVRAGLTFGPDGRVAIDTGCNTGSASYTVDVTDGTLDLGPIALTKKACRDQAGETETVMVTVLGAHPLSYHVDSTVLELRSAGFGLQLRGTQPS